MLSDNYKSKLSPEWFNILKPIIDDKRFGEILKVLSKDKDNFEPAFDNIFKAFQVTDYNKLSVVILGQDPYPQKGVATGVAFANIEGVSWSPSLNIIMDELQESIEEFNEFIFMDKIDLMHLCKQGVLLLNSAFTVRRNAPGSHAEVWKYFTSQLLSNLSSSGPNKLVFVLMGKIAQEFESSIQTKSMFSNNIVLKSPHPAADTYGNKFFFRGSNIFSQVNDSLVSLGKNKIIWDGQGI